MSDGFQRTLARIRSAASSPAEQGTLFERLMKQYFRLDPRYSDQFPGVWRGSDWAALRPDFARQDTGADLVVEERGSGFSAIQCKFHGPGTQITKQAFDSFISASARDPFTRRIVVDTGDAWGPNAPSSGRTRHAPIQRRCLRAPSGFACDHANTPRSRTCWRGSLQSAAAS